MSGFWAAGGLNPDPTAPLVYIDDFLGGSTETGEIGDNGWQFLNGTIAGIGGVADHPGIIRYTSSAVSGTVCALYLGGAGATVTTGTLATINEVDEFTFVFREQTAGITDLTMRVGLLGRGDVATANGIYLEKVATTDTNWFLTGRVGGVDVARTDTTVAAGTTNWLKAKFRRISTGEWRVSINGAAEVAATATVGAATLAPIVQLVPGSANARGFEIDFFSLKTKVLAR